MTQYNPEACRIPGFMYSADDTGNPIFPGDFDNFGYWENTGTPGQPPTLDDRIASQENLYRVIAEAADIQPGDVVLEVACGRGRGMRWLADTIGPAEIYGVDASGAQVARAAAAVRDIAQAQVQHAPAESLPFDDGMFDRAFSLEAIQHFTSPESFVHELGRVVRTTGTIAVASFFTPHDSRTTTVELAKSLPTFEDGIDKAVNIVDMAGWLERAGFGDIEATSIGDKVWERFVEWRNIVKEPPSMAWLDAYRHNLLDYFMVTATKERSNR